MLNTTAIEEDPFVTQDGGHIYFASDRNGTNDIFEASALGR